MDATLFIQSLLGLISLLAILLFFLLYNFKDKEKTVKKDISEEVIAEEKKEKRDTSMEALRKVIRHENTSTEVLKETIELLLKYHGSIHPKLGTRTHPDFDNYAEILFYLGRHKNTNKELLLLFDKGLEERNPEYKKEINDALMKGLNSRGI
ncbi:MAG: hypothetical protein JXQ67_06485 [Campylobacterales bacterium]|nr:hypothetical protein [Campylobacterales bacterium]